MNDNNTKFLQTALGVEADGEIGPITRKAFADKLIKIASKEVGVKEIEDSNTGKRVQEYQASTDLDGTGWPYCAAFVCFVIKQMGVFNERNRPKTAAAFGFEVWGRDLGLNVSKTPSSVKRGDLVIFKYSHIGIATSDSDKNGRFTTIEANTSSGDGGSQRDGGGVYKRTRSISTVRSTVRL